ncbi:MAG: hypothetical protein IPP74_07980 [Alphaproteobacteria bacterium]|nr:hypothetical protein [Alphaproteobacteria bacterium]
MDQHLNQKDQPLILLAVAENQAVAKKQAKQPITPRPPKLTKKKSLVKGEPNAEDLKIAEEAGEEKE